MRWWKVIGVASVVGVAATGVVLARAERRRRAYTPDQIRDRLRERHAEAVGEATSTDSGPTDGPNKSQTSQ
ncbi:hypothetical protein ACQEVC_21400 [Plantactinospora sp. CA-294935]|uniref:hypothetical protein n=1 Tax=Plantactinospora sp. CA-294935 TaxID=3240012 RepID=UPI003D925599